ncbi:MAG: undecaprenyl-diphosphate phosphatase [Halanaerobiaceae bacterium]
MEILKSLLLGIIQGITEFLPISSSGHLVLFQRILGITEGNLTLNIFLHFGTLIPVLIIFWNDIKDIILFKSEKKHLIWLIIVGSIPTGFIGIFLEGYSEILFSSVLITGFMLLITGFLLYIAEKVKNYSKQIKDFKSGNAIIVGIAQGMAIIPGISRSGSTIIAALFQKLDKKEAARFSFLLSIPAITGANILKIKELLNNQSHTGISLFPLLLGTLTAAIAGYFAIKYLLHILEAGSLIVFSYYCWILGLIVIFTAGLF